MNRTEALTRRRDPIRRAICPDCQREMTLLRRRRKGEYDLNPPWRFVRHNMPAVDGRPSGVSSALCEGSYKRGPR